MKKKLLIFVSLILAAQLGFSGGIVHNTNQSTAWTRMLVRDASLGIDAVFYNPAGLTRLNDGFHFSISNQSLFQKQTIVNSYTHLNNDSYEGNISAPLFPGIYAAWKKGKIAVSIGFNPLGGGGGATFDKGLPSMEIPLSNLVPSFGGIPGMGQAYPSAYSMDMSFEGTSIYWGLQAGVSYQVTDNISLFAGARYIMAKNTYNGYIKDVNVMVGESEMAPGAYAQSVSDIAAANAGHAIGGADGMQPLIDAGAGGYTFGELEGGEFITPELRAQMEGGLLALGIPQEQIDGMTAAVAQGTLYEVGAQLTGASQQLAGQAAYLNVITADQEADVAQTGSAITPIVGANFNFMESKLNIGVKYEFHTKMDLTNEVAADKGFVTGMNPATGEKSYMFVDGDKVNADIPAFLSIGASYEIIDPLTIQVGYHTYFDKEAGWATAEDGTELIDKNFNEYAVGLEYNITDKFLVSAGYLVAITGANDDYQSDLSFSLSTNTVGGGFAYKINDMLTAQIGGFFTSYKDLTVDKSYMLGETVIPATETYDKETFAVSVGVDISL